MITLKENILNVLNNNMINEFFMKIKMLQILKINELRDFQILMFKICFISLLIALITYIIF